MAVGALGALEFDLSLRDKLTKPMERMFNASTALGDSMKEVSKATDVLRDKTLRNAMMAGAGNLATVALVKNTYEYAGAAWKLHAAVSANIQSTKALVWEQLKLKGAYGATTDEIKAVTSASALLKVSGKEMSELNNTILEFGEVSGLGAAGAAKLSTFLSRDLMIPTKDLRPAFGQLGQVIRSVKISGDEAAAGLTAADAAMSKMTVDARAKQLPAIIKITGAFKDMGVDVSTAMDALDRMMDIQSSSGVLMTSKVAPALGMTGQQLREGLADGSVDASKAMEALVKSLVRGGQVNSKNVLQMKIQAKLYGVNEKEMFKMVRAVEKGGKATKGFTDTMQGSTADTLDLRDAFMKIADPIARVGSSLGSMIVTAGGMITVLYHTSMLLKKENYERILGLGLKAKDIVLNGTETATRWLHTAALEVENSNLAAGTTIRNLSFVGKMRLMAMDLKTIAISKLQAAWTGIVTAAQWAFNVAMDANPIGLIIIAVVALVAAFVWLQKKFDIIGIYVKIMKMEWDALCWVWDKLWTGIKIGASWIADKFMGLVDIGKKLFDVFMGGDLGDSFLAKALTWLLRLANPIAMVMAGFKKIKSLFKSGASTEAPSMAVKAMAGGGVVTSPTVALIGEAGPEAVVPLSRASKTPTIIGTGEIVRTLEKLIDVVRANGQKDTGSSNMDLGMDYPIYRLIGSYGV